MSTQPTQTTKHLSSRPSTNLWERGGGPLARTKQTGKVPAVPGENKGKLVRFPWEEGLDIIRMYGILELAKRKVNLQRSPPEGHAQAYREMMRHSCDAANREAKKRKKKGEWQTTHRNCWC